MKLRDLTDGMTPRPWLINTPVRCDIAGAAVMIAAAAVSFQLAKFLDTTVLFLNAAVQSFIAAGAAAALALLFFAPPLKGGLRDKLSLRPLGRQDIKLIFAGLAAILAGNALIIVPLWELILKAAGMDPVRVQPLLMLVPEAENPEFAALLLTIGILTPAAEELFFRRLIYGALLPAGGTAAAVLTTSAVFAAAHGFIYGSPALFWMGTVFQLAYLKSGNFTVPVILHSAVNLITLITVRCGGMNL